MNEQQRGVAGVGSRRRRHLAEAGMNDATRGEQQPESETVSPMLEGRPRPDQSAVALRAYERFQTRGGEHGRDQEDWFAAERELSALGNA